MTWLLSHGKYKCVLSHPMGCFPMLGGIISLSILLLSNCTCKLSQISFFSKKSTFKSIQPLLGNRPGCEPYHSQWRIDSERELAFLFIAAQ